MLFLLALLKGGVVDPVTQVSQTQDRMYNNKAFQKPDVDVNSEHQQDAALKIQTKYRQHQSKAVVDQMRQDKAAVKIQAGIRGHLGRKRVANLRKEVAGSSRHSFNAEDENELEELAQEDEFNINEEEEETSRTHDSIDPETATRITTLPASPLEAVLPVGRDEEEIDIDLGDPEVQKAAVLIQSGFRGLKSRRKPQPPLPPPSSSPIPPSSQLYTIMQASSTTQMNSLAATPSESVQPDAKETEEIDIDLGDPEVQKAAAFIQSGFRGLKARRKQPPPPSSPQPTPLLPSPPASLHTTAISKVEPEEETTIPKSPVSEVDGDIGIDLNDPEIQVAATKIQAGFRGMRTRQHLKPRQIEESKDYDEDLLARDEFAAFDETEDLERGEMESERHETPNSQVKRSGAQEDIMQEDEGAELEFCEDDPEMMKAIEEIQGSFRRLEADDENVDEVVENDEQENLEMEAAATKIQAGFKGMKLRRELKGNKVVKKVNNEEEAKEIRADEETEMEAAATKIQAGFKGMKLRKELKEKKVVKKVNNEEEPKEMQADEETEMEAAATKIQAGFKGMKLRRELKETKVVKKVINEEPKEIQADEETGAENLDTEETSDVELRVAANKIQAGFRGYQTRKEVQRMKREKGEELTSQEKIKEEHEAEEEKNNDENEEKRVFAASKIQAGFKGYKTRREVDIARRQKAEVNDVKDEEEGHENHIVDEENQMKEAVEQFEEEP